MPDVLVNTDASSADRADGARAVWTGADGVRALSRGRRVEAASAAAYRAESLATEYDGVTISRFRTSPLRIVQGAAPPGAARGVVLALVVEGSARIAHDGLAYSASAGDLLAIGWRSAYELEAADPLSLVLLQVPADRLPLRMVEADSAPRGLLPPTRLTASVGVFLHRLAAGPAAGSGPDRVYLARAMAELAVAVLTEAAGDDPPEDRVESLRARVRELVDRHLGDPDLGPQMLAAQLGVSVRYVHRVFNTGDETVAGYIRERRLEAVARVLRSDHRPHRVGVLAARFGFSGRDHLTRAFRQQYGMTVREYQDAAAEAAGSMLAATRLPV